MKSGNDITNVNISNLCIYAQYLSGKISYKKMGSVTVDKTHVWDNRYNAGEDSESTKGDSDQKIKETYFNGGKGVMPGMILKQKK